MTWPTISAIVAVPPALGAIVDRLMAAKQKSALHLRLIGVWDRLDGVRVADIDGAVSQGVLRRLSPLRHHRLLVLLVGCIVSWLLTNSAFYIGRHWDGQKYSFFSWDDLPYGTLYFSNAVFDGLTVGLCLLMMKHMAQARSFTRRLAFSAMNIVGAMMLAFLSLVGSVWLDHIAITLHLPLSTEVATYQQSQWFGEQRRQAAQMFGVSESAVEGIPLSLQQDTLYIWSLCKTMIRGKPVAYTTIVHVDVKQRGNVIRLEMPATYENRHWHAAMLYGITTLLPVATFTAVVVLMLISKILVSSARYVLMNYLEVATEADPSRSAASFVPFTLLGSLLGVVVLLMTLALSVLRELRPT